MTDTPSKPPPSIANARVLEYAVLNESVSYSGHSNVFRKDVEVGPVPRLAICETLASKTTSVLLIHCGENWEVLGIESCDSVEDAHARAEQAYPGISGCWLPANLSRDEALANLDPLLDIGPCHFCRRDAAETERMVEKNGVRICESCIKACYAMLQEDGNSGGHLH